MWLYYWLAGARRPSVRDVGTTVIPPPQMVAEAARWIHRRLPAWRTVERARAARRSGFTVATSQQVWPIIRKKY